MKTLIKIPFNHYEIKKKKHEYHSPHLGETSAYGFRTPTDATSRCHVSEANSAPEAA